MNYATFIEAVETAAREAGIYNNGNFQVAFAIREKFRPEGDGVLMATSNDISIDMKAVAYGYNNDVAAINPDVAAKCIYVVVS